MSRKIDSVKANFIEHRHEGDILNSNAVVILNPVTREGSMGRGMSKRIRKKYPAMYRHYRTMCHMQDVFPHLEYGYKIPQPTNKTLYIFNIDFKNTWRDRIEYKNFITVIDRISYYLRVNINHDYYTRRDLDKKDRKITLAMPMFFYDIENHSLSDMLDHIANKFCSFIWFERIILYHNEIV